MSTITVTAIAPRPATRLRITARGDRFIVVAEGGGERAELDWRDPAPYQRGQIGLSTWHGSHTAYADLRISPAQVSE